jgi:hypothetical protein
MNIVIISGSCCIPSMANIDKIARQIVDEAISKTGVQAKVSAITASAAYGSDTYRKIIKKGIGISDAPVILIDGEVISYGMPKIEDLKNSLMKFSKNPKKSKGE